jgi:3-oxoadipate enol-lactonase
MPKAKVGDINLYYEIHGKGEPLVMIMGGTASLEWSYRAIPVFSREYRLILFDNRGAGRSDKPDISYTMEMMTDDLAGLLDAIGIDSAHIQGGSLGGMIAQQFALRYPKRVRSLILACTACGGTHGVTMIDPEMIRAVERLQGLPLKKRMMETLRLSISQEFIDKKPGLVQEYVAKMIEHPAPLQTMMRHTHAALGHDTYDRLPEIKAPTLVIAGDADRFIPVKNSRILASRIPGAELVILKNMGHMFNLEAEDESNKIMLDFLKRHSKSGKER